MMKQQISPELVLVDPELARQARRELRLSHTLASSRSQATAEVWRPAGRKTLTSILSVSLFAVGLVAAVGIDTMVASPTPPLVTTAVPNAASPIQPRLQAAHDMSVLDAEREILALVARAAPGTPLARFNDESADDVVVRCTRRRNRMLCVVRGLQQQPVHLAAPAGGAGVPTVIATSSE